MFVLGVNERVACLWLAPSDRAANHTEEALFARHPAKITASLIYMSPAEITDIIPAAIGCG